jgi:hypothetical protein
LILISIFSFPFLRPGRRFTFVHVISH